MMTWMSRLRCTGAVNQKNLSLMLLLVLQLLLPEYFFFSLSNICCSYWKSESAHSLEKKTWYELGAVTSFTKAGGRWGFEPGRVRFSEENCSAVLWIALCETPDSESEPNLVCWQSFSVNIVTLYHIIKLLILIIWDCLWEDPAYEIFCENRVWCKLYPRANSPASLRPLAHFA